jgi:arylsulfatase A-like enzyme
MRQPSKSGRALTSLAAAALAARDLRMAASALTLLLALTLAGLVDRSPADATSDTQAPHESRAAGDNVILVIGDDMGVETIRAYGEGDNPAHTPTLDALIENGLLFQNAWAYPLCTPFRASVLTGRHGFRTGVGTVVGGTAAELPYEELIIPEVLDANPDLGVAHAAIGKWHLSTLRGNNANTAPNRHGFSHYAGSLGVPADYYAWERVVDGQAATSNDYVTSVQVDDALDWVSAQDGPFFLYLAFSAPHAPFHRPPDGMYSQTLPPGVFQRGMDATPYFLAAIEALDHELGRLLDSMDPAQRARTNVIFMGDNGSPGQAVQAPFERLRSKSTLYQGGIWTPLLVSGPAVSEPGRVEDAPVSSVDLFATVLELLGVEPQNWASQTDSLSLLPYLQEPGRPPLRDWTFSEQFDGADRPEEDGKAIRDARYKYLRFDDGRRALYDLEADPYEDRNLLEGELDADASAALDRLEEQLDRLLANPPSTPSPIAPATATVATQAAPRTSTPSATSPSPATTSPPSSVTPSPDPGGTLYLPWLTRGP